MVPVRAFALVVLGFLVGFAAGACSGQNQAEGDQDAVGETGKEAGSMSLKLTSSVFEESSAIPGKYTCDGEDVSPPLTWEGAPQGTKSFALIADDPDAPRGTWVHWVVYNIPVTRTELPEAVASTESIPAGGTQGMTDFGRIGYGGPCPPGGTHRYFFKLYALDTMLDLEPGATKKELIEAMEGHVLAQDILMGTYAR
jgi:hypothetical protein